MTEIRPEFVEALRQTFRRMLPHYLLDKHAERGDKIKSDGTPVGNLDLYAADELRAAIEPYFPNAVFLREEDRREPKELETILTDQTALQWAIDGLDGTGNRSEKLESFGAMVALRQGPEVLFSAIFRPIMEHVYGEGFFYAVRGKGAWQWCDNHDAYERLQTARAGTLKRMEIMLEGGSKKFYRPPISGIGQVITTRPSQSSSVAATTVAMGRSSAMLTVDHDAWDDWPSALLIEEAGGVVTDWDGNPFDPGKCRNMLAAANASDSEAILGTLWEKIPEKTLS